VEDNHDGVVDEEATTEAECTGVWIANGKCLEYPCNGACCDPVFGCTQSSQSDCEDLGYVFAGSGVPCVPDPCPAGCETDADCKCSPGYTYIAEADTCCPPGTQWGPWPPDDPSNPPACYDAGTVTGGSSPVNGYCCDGECQAVECCKSAGDCTPPPGEAAECCAGTCKNTLDDTGACYENYGDISETCTEIHYTDCTRDNQSNVFFLCETCPP